MFKIAIIGCGQLGSRHLQSLCKLQASIQIFAIDPYQASLDTARQRASEIPRTDRISISYHRSIESIHGTDLNLAIIATNSDSRFKIFQELVSSVNLEHVIFEKFLFQKEEHYHQVSLLLSEKKIKGWVNCSRRMFPSYQTLIKDWKTKGCFDYKFEGGAWGLACNMVHHVDFYQAITGARIESINLEKLEPNPVPSKRSGFLEFFGELNIKMSNGGTITLISRNSNLPPLTEITFQEELIQIDEVKGLLKIKGMETKIEIPFQSQLTQLVVERMLNGLEPQLPTFEESSEYHLKLLGAFLERYMGNGFFGDRILPIT